MFKLIQHLALMISMAFVSEQRGVQTECIVRLPAEPYRLSEAERLVKTDKIAN